MKLTINRLVFISLLIFVFSQRIFAQDSLAIYMSPSGLDSNTGLTQQQAVKTLNRVHAIVQVQIAHKHQHIEVRIASGKYDGQHVKWQATMPEHAITFMPLDETTERPLFDGQRSPNTWFILDQANGQAANLVFYKLHIKNYQAAISLNGNRNNPDHFNAYNVISDNYFEQIGNYYTRTPTPAYAAVRLLNSQHNKIINNHFIDIRNVQANHASIHAIYIAHYANQNIIKENIFQLNTGDAVRVRDYSNYNKIINNRYHQAGHIAGYSEWYCDSRIRHDCTKPEPECPSWGNEFRDNLLALTFTQTRLKVWVLHQDDRPILACLPPNVGDKRLRTSGNIIR